MSVSLPDDFTGIVRLFPLPNVVLFPQVILPLHVFEPRYHALTVAAIESDQLIGMSLLKSGWQADYDDAPPLHAEICIGRVLAHAKLPERRFNVLLQGVARARTVEELPQSRLYREARVELLADVATPDEWNLRLERQRKLFDLFRQAIPDSEQWERQLEQILSQPHELGLLADLVAYSLRLPVEFKQTLLAELNVDRRATKLLSHLEAMVQIDEAGTSEDDSTFPPRFSDN